MHVVVVVEVTVTDVVVVLVAAETARAVLNPVNIKK